MDVNLALVWAAVLANELDQTWIGSAQISSWCLCGFSIPHLQLIICDTSADELYLVLYV